MGRCNAFCHVWFASVFASYADPRFDAGSEPKSPRAAATKDDTTTTRVFHRPYKARNFVGVPVKGANGRVIGVLMATNKHDACRFTTVDLSLLALLSTEAAIVLNSFMLADGLRMSIASSFTVRSRLASLVPRLSRPLSAGLPGTVAWLHAAEELALNVCRADAVRLFVVCNGTVFWTARRLTSTELHATGVTTVDCSAVGAGAGAGAGAVHLPAMASLRSSPLAKVMHGSLCGATFSAPTPLLIRPPAASHPTFNANIDLEDLRSPCSLVSLACHFGGAPPARVAAADESPVACGVLQLYLADSALDRSSVAGGDGADKTELGNVSPPVVTTMAQELGCLLPFVAANLATWQDAPAASPAPAVVFPAASP